jgi:hypothetical protein
MLEHIQFKLENACKCSVRCLLVYNYQAVFRVTCACFRWLWADLDCKGGETSWQRTAEEKYSCLVNIGTWIAGCSWGLTSIRGSLGFKHVQLACLGTFYQDLVVEGLQNVMQSTRPSVDPRYSVRTFLMEVLMFCITFIPVTGNVKQLSEESRSHIISGDVIPGKELRWTCLHF